MMSATGEIRIKFPWCAFSCHPWELRVFLAGGQNSSPLICGGTWHFFGPFHVFLYKWAVLHLPGSVQRCQSLKRRNRTERVRDAGISHGEGSALAEKSWRENTHFLCCKDWEEKREIPTAKVGRKKRNAIYWSCKPESSEVGPTWKRLSEGAFKLLTKHKKPQQHYIPVPQCEQACWIGAQSSQGPNGPGRAQKLEEQQMGQFPWNVRVSSPSNVCFLPGEERAVYEPVLRLSCHCQDLLRLSTLRGSPRMRETGRKGDSLSSGNLERFSVTLWVIQVIPNHPGCCQHQAMQKKEDAALRWLIIKGCK